MVVNPQEILDRIKQEQDRALIKLEQTIDAKLRTFDGSAEITVTVSPYSRSLNRANRETLLKKYEAVNWRVRVEDNDSGTYWMFNYSEKNSQGGQ